MGTEQKEPRYCKRLIEVDLPIRQISEHARREKSIRHGHISTLHLWWARRPLAACRAVVLASCWPDPADPLCPESFRSDSRTAMERWCREAKIVTDPEAFKRSVSIQRRPEQLTNLIVLRQLLFDFIANFANWDLADDRLHLELSRTLVSSAQRALDASGPARPTLVDPFAGGGAIPLEAMRVGFDVVASDINPVPVLLNKAILVDVQKYGDVLADQVRKWGTWVNDQAEKQLSEFYPKDPDGAVPIAYLWARTIICEGPGCGADVPLLRSAWLTKKKDRSVAVELVPNRQTRQVGIRLIVREHGGWKRDDDSKTSIDAPRLEGTVKRGAATCVCCGYTTAVESVRKQLNAKHGGTDGARLIAVVTNRKSELGRFYRLATAKDVAAFAAAADELRSRRALSETLLDCAPEELLPPAGALGFRVQPYGMTEWRHLFSSRQLLALTTLAKLIRAAGVEMRSAGDPGLGEAVQRFLALALGRLADRCCALCTWDPTPTASGILHLFGRQAVPMVWDYAEGLPLESKSGGWLPSLEWVALVIERERALSVDSAALVTTASATKQPLPDNSASLFFTDPPYYDAVPYADLSMFFSVWLKRALPNDHWSVDIDSECIVDTVRGKDRRFFEVTMQKAMAEGQRVLAANGIGVVVFAHKSTAGWETQLQAMIDAGWVVTGSWPIDTEMGTRLRAQNSAALASSIHLVCRPRERAEGGALTDVIGDWREILDVLSVRIAEWMPRLAAEGVVGADAIFACLGPALEVYSRYSRVEKASGEPVPLREYLEQVWAVVARQALSVIFAGVDTSGFDADARLTAMWLWTIGAGAVGGADDDTAAEESGGGGDGKTKGATRGFSLEYDAARKIAQGLGASLESLPTLVAVKGDTARLLAVDERRDFLFGKPKTPLATTRLRKGKKKQLTLDVGASEEEDESDAPGELPPANPGDSLLDRVHQSMLLFDRGQSAALKRFLVEDGVGKNENFWRLAQALSALYPTGTDEKRWVDGVLARRKGLGI